MTKAFIPVLDTGRLRLEPLTREHSKGMFELWSAPEVCRYCPKAVDVDGKPVDLPACSPVQSDKIIDFFLDYAAKGKGFRWAMIEKDSGAFVGSLGFNSLGRISELAYHQVPGFWGRGLMTEACESAINWVREESACVHIEAFIELENHASIALAERLGFMEISETREGACRYML